MKQHIRNAILITFLFAVCVYMGYTEIPTENSSNSTLISSAVFCLIIGLPLRYITYIISLMMRRKRKSEEVEDFSNKLTRTVILLSTVIFVIGSGLTLGTFVKDTHVSVITFSLMCIGFGGLLGAIFPKNLSALKDY